MFVGIIGIENLPLEIFTFNLDVTSLYWGTKVMLSKEIIYDKLVGQVGFDPTTYCFSDNCSTN